MGGILRACLNWEKVFQTVELGNAALRSRQLVTQHILLPFGIRARNFATGIRREIFQLQKAVCFGTKAWWHEVSTAEKAGC